MSSLRPLHRQAAQHFDERFIRKQSESFLSQPEQTIWVSRHRTLRTQYSLKAVQNSYKLQRLLQVAVFVYALFYSH